MLTAIGGAEHAALLLRPGGATEHAGEDDIGIRRMDDDAADSPRLRQPHVLPGSTGIRGLVDSVAHHVTVADRPGLTGPCPHRARLGRCDRECSDGCDILLVEDRFPAVAAIDRLPYPAGGGPGVVDARIARDCGDGRYPVADLRPHETKLEGAFLLGVRRLLLLGVRGFLLLGFRR